MTQTPEEILAEFHRAVGETPVIERDAFDRRKFYDLRMSLIKEEFKELMDELLDARNGEGNYENTAKEIADLVVVVVGTAQLLDIPFTEVFTEVMRSNMSKIPADGVIRRRADGKVLKPETYTPADLSFLTDPFRKAVPA